MQIHEVKFEYWMKVIPNGLLFIANAVPGCARANACTILSRTWMKKKKTSVLDHKSRRGVMPFYYAVAKTTT